MKIKNVVCSTLSYGVVGIVENVCVFNLIFKRVLEMSDQPRTVSKSDSTKYFQLGQISMALNSIKREFKFQNYF